MTPTPDLLESGNHHDGAHCCSEPRHRRSPARSGTTFDIENLPDDAPGKGKTTTA